MSRLHPWHLGRARTAGACCRACWCEGLRYYTALSVQQSGMNAAAHQAANCSTSIKKGSHLQQPAFSSSLSAPKFSRYSCCAGAGRHKADESCCAGTTGLTEALQTSCQATTGLHVKVDAKLCVGPCLRLTHWA